MYIAYLIQEPFSASVARGWHISSTQSRSGTLRSRSGKLERTWILTHIWRSYTKEWTAKRILLGGTSVNIKSYRLTFMHRSDKQVSSHGNAHANNCPTCFCLHVIRYTTSIDGKDVNFNSCVMHRFYEQEVKEGGGGHHAIHLVMDPSLDDGKVTIRAYISKNIKLGDILQFQEIPVEVVASPAERVGGPSFCRCRSTPMWLLMQRNPYVSER